MENTIILNGFSSLSMDEMNDLNAGGIKDIDFGEVGYNFGKGWCEYWMNVGGKAYDLFH